MLQLSPSHPTPPPAGNLSSKTRQVGYGLHYRWIFFLLPLVLALTLGGGCKQNPLGPDAGPVADTAARNGQPAVPDTMTLHARIVQLDSELTVLKTNFQYRQHNLPVPSYYHKNWWGNYYIRDVALMAGVDSAGTFFLIDSYNCSMGRWPESGQPSIHRMEDCDPQNSRLELRMKDTTIVLPVRPDLPGKLWPEPKNEPIIRDMILSTGHFCTDYYPIPDDPALVHLLADPEVGYFKFYRYCGGRGYGDLGHAEKRDRNGIRDCARLSELILEIQELRDSISQFAMR
jgi:hypothetical protein